MRQHIRHKPCAHDQKMSQPQTIDQSIHGTTRKKQDNTNKVTHQKLRLQFKVRKKVIDQESIQSSTTPDPGHHMGK